MTVRHTATHSCARRVGHGQCGRPQGTSVRQHWTGSAPKPYLQPQHAICHDGSPCGALSAGARPDRLSTREA
jgi:hypothetical protein